jgi:hypothetical protein
MPSGCIVTQRFTVSAATGHDGRIYAFAGSDGSGSILASVEARNKPVVLAELTITPAVVVGGESAVGTVTLSCSALPTGLLVTLAPTVSGARVPTSVTVAGRAATTFSITTSTVTTIESWNISGNRGGDHEIRPRHGESVGQRIAELARLGAMRRYPVSARVNQGQNDFAECTRPVDLESSPQARLFR